MNGAPGMCGLAKEGMSRGLKPRLVVVRNARAKARAYLRSKSKSKSDGKNETEVVMALASLCDALQMLRWS
jgi:hypothetical protein